MSSLRQEIPLNPVDKALLALDTRSERMTYHLVLTILGEIEPAKLSHAISLAIQAHPAMRSILRVKRFRYFREEQLDFAGEVLTIRDFSALRDSDGSASSGHDGVLLQWMNQPMNLKEDIPVRALLLKRTPRDHVLVFTFHHCAADGLRALRFVREVIGRYNEEDITGLLRDEDTCSCHRRDELLSFVQARRARTKHFYLKMLGNLSHRLVVASLSPPARIVHDRCGRNSGDVWFVHRTLYPPQRSQFASGAGTLGVSLNDLLLACCFRTVDKWNQMHGRRCLRISVMMPVEVGRRSSAGVISNQISYISPSTAPKDRAHAASLLKNTAKIRANLMRNGSHVSIIYLAYAVSFLPLPLVRAIARLVVLTRIYTDTILLTNVGTVWPRPHAEEGRTTLGRGVISELTGIGPVIAPFRMALVASVYNGALDISLTYRTCLVSLEKARSFLDLYVGELLSLSSDEEGNSSGNLAGVNWT